MQNEFYYEIHIFSRKNGRYEHIKSTEMLSDDDVIGLAVKEGIINEDDADRVDYIETLTKTDYEIFSKEG